MTKIVAWLVLIFVVLLALRLVNARNARLRRAARSQGEPAAQSMVKCGQCGVFLPRADAKMIGNNTYACADGQCSKRS